MKMRLKMLKGKCEARKLPRPDGYYYLGRAESCHFGVDDPEVAERHCAIRIGKNRIVLTVLSGNPTLVNGSVIAEKCELFDGDVITVGGTRFCLLLLDHSPQDRLAGDVTQWLSEEDEKQRLLRDLDPDARRYPLSQEPSSDSSVSTLSTEKLSTEKPTEAPEATSTERTRPGRRPPQKLPPPPAPDRAASSHDAASQVLDQMFQRLPRDKRN